MKKTRDFTPRTNLIQFRVLLARYLKQIVTNPWIIIPLILQPAVMLVITSLVYDDGTFAEPWHHVTSANSVPFLLVLSSALMGLLNSYREICKEREVLGREVFGGLDIVAYIAELGELDLTGVEPTAHAAPLSNVWREDVAGEPFGRERMLANAPALMNGDLIRVPQVLPGEGMN